jgi:hypothetical protein
MNTQISTVKQVSIWASGLGRKAFGELGQLSVFARAFLESMAGSAARLNLDSGEWEVSVQDIAEGVNACVKARHGPGVQTAVTGQVTEAFTFHALATDPVVPVEVACLPKARMPELELRCLDIDQNLKAFRTTGHAANWFPRLLHGVYTFSAYRKDAGHVCSRLDSALPPMQSILLRVPEHDHNAES